MQSHHAASSGLGLSLGDDITADATDNVVPLFAPRVGGVAELVAAAAGPTQPRELLGESDARAIFRAAMIESPPSVRRRHKLAPFAIAAGSVAGLVAGTAGLSAAAVLPPVANHVVAQVLRQVGIDVAPASSLATVPTVSRSSNTTAPRSGEPRPPRGVNQNSAAIANLNTSKGTTPPKATQPAVAGPPQCEVVVIQNQVVLMRVTLSATGEAIPVANALPLTPPGPCSHSQITQLEKMAAKGSGSSTTGTTPVPVVATGPTTGTGGSGGTTGTTGTGGSGPGGTSGGTGGTGGTGTGGGSTGSGKGTNQGGGGTGSGKGTNHGGGKGHHGGNGGSTTGTTTPPSSTDPDGTTTTTTAPTSTTDAP